MTSRIAHTTVDAANAYELSEWWKQVLGYVDVADDPNEPVPWMQQLLDNPFLLLFLGVMIPMVVYTVWGVFDILTVPLAK